MVFDVAGPSYFASSHDDGTRSYPVDAGTSSYVYSGCGLYDYDESGLADRFSNIVHAADQPLRDGYNQSQLGVAVELVVTKADGHIFERIYDRILWANRILPFDHTLTGDYYNTKKLKDNVDLEYCKFYGDGRYKPARGRDPHWKKSSYAILRYLSLTSPYREVPRNIWLGLCTDGFVLHGQYGRTYSRWLVIITPYNFSLGMCMSSEYIFMMMVIPDPSDPIRPIDVYLEPLIKKLLQLWHVG
ncbi:UNVERIFIED_CONTAM: hypothetical protein Sangu_2838100 [Sesamum angustifolium]|uniref:Uncharacterized protein n=1 Tax=Sesamum angustifolium TaxID=2727405 RepID=A0AAW2IQ42_9LAMI